MQALSRTFCRFYATKPPTLPHAALAARTASTPMAVRIRRQKKLGKADLAALEQKGTDATPLGLTPSESARYQRLKALGRIPAVDGVELSEEQWLEKVNRRRTRIRGVRTVKRDGEADETEVLGRRVYLPNIIFRLVRNNTPPGQPYNPYEATFRIPKSITKTDIRSYLLTIYGVETTYIRTDNYISPVFTRLRGQRKAFKTYKRAVVGLVEPFYYPHRLEDMESKQRVEREKWIEDNFQIQATRNQQKYELLRLTKGQAKGWSFNEPMATKRSHILRLVAERREKREKLVLEQAAEWQAKRARGEKITSLLPRKPSLLDNLPATTN
ncbi:hypothetical protein BDN72DRAFT_462741 [Pluteus cervinus]|uniref:Uncharacterized protein n=1 Tax=Pluteus cervinus TaxID=181527 RepID=A0ACD3B002_9AGAR|nr:hypothetical protein BDN72DRAFT_462741 [Pluteus cervinus]